MFSSLLQRAFANWTWQLAWLAVFVGNLIVPVMFGLEVTRNGGRVGMWIAVGLYWLLGHLACARFKEAGPILVTGGIMIGLTQCYPILHIMLGIFNLAVVRGLGIDLQGMRESSSGLREFGGYLATILTGGQLIAAAALCGMMVRLPMRKNREIAAKKEEGGLRDGAMPVVGDPVTGIQVIE